METCVANMRNITKEERGIEAMLTSQICDFFSLESIIKLVEAASLLHPITVKRMECPGLLSI